MNHKKLWKLYNYCTFSFFLVTLPLQMHIYSHLLVCFLSLFYLPSISYVCILVLYLLFLLVTMSLYSILHVIKYMNNICLQLYVL